MRAVWAVAIVCLAAGQLAADPRAQAEALFREGKDLMAAGKHAEACAAFEASQKAQAATSTLLNLANCREKNGQLATAWGLFVEVERQTRSATDAITKQFHKSAAERASNLERRISHLTIAVPDKNRIASLEVLRDGATVDSGSWNRRLPIDGGRYVIEARAPGHDAWKTTIEVAGHDDDRKVEVPALQQAAEQAESPVREAPRSRTGAWVLTGTTLALAGAAIGFDLWARDTYDKTLVAADPNLQTALWKSANRKRYVADGIAVAAIGCGIAAIWLFVRPSSSTRSTTARVQPTATSDSAGLVLVGGW